MNSSHNKEWIPIHLVVISIPSVRFNSTIGYVSDLATVCLHSRTGQSSWYFVDYIVKCLCFCDILRFIPNSTISHFVQWLVSSWGIHMYPAAYMHQAIINHSADRTLRNNVTAECLIWYVISVVVSWEKGCFDWIAFSLACAQKTYDLPFIVMFHEGLHNMKYYYPH